MKKLFFALLVLLGCSKEVVTSKPTIVVTNNIIASIIKELTGPTGNVICLLSPGDSPHTYSTKPSDATNAKLANLFIYTSENLDGWASSLESSNKVELIKFVPKELLLSFDNSPSNIDPHFWTDPMVIKAILPALVELLSKSDKSNENSYKTNAELFSKRLDLLDKQLADLTKDLKGKTAYLFHPSFRYFLKRYNINYGGSIEEIPGKEPTANTISNLIKKINSTGTKAIFTEPQLNEESATALVEAAKLSIYELDPIGGSKGRESYTDLMIYNAKTLKMALQ